MQQMPRGPERPAFIGTWKLEGGCLLMADFVDLVGWVVGVGGFRSWQKRPFSFPPGHAVWPGAFRGLVWFSPGSLVSRWLENWRWIWSELSKLPQIGGDCGERRFGLKSASNH